MSFKADTMVFHNPTEHTIKLDSIGLDPVAPGQDVEVPLYLAAPVRADNGQRGKSPLEQVAPQLHPKDPADKAAWLEVPPHATAQSKIVTIAARAPSESPGVKALREKAEAAAKAKVQNVAPNALGKPQTSATAPAGKA